MNYSKIYSRIVNAAKSREVVGYVEVHHIVPKSMGGTNSDDNLVSLTAREHFLVHWLLFKIYNSPAMARAFRLMADTNGKLHGRTYQGAKEIYAASMMGEDNVSKRDDVKARISVGVKANHPWKGKKRPKQAKLMAEKKLWAGSNNIWYGTGARQVGTKNHMARKVTGVHPLKGTQIWGTLKAASEDIGVSIQAVCQAIKKQQNSKGWHLEHCV